MRGERIEAYMLSVCFRPLTGIMVLHRPKAQQGLHQKVKKFPSPYGDYGSSQNFLPDCILTLNRFPSPYGDYGSSQHPLPLA